MTPDGHAPSPGLAAVLGFIPGVGAMYNGQFAKALIHVLVFVSIIWITSNGSGFFGNLYPVLRLLHGVRCLQNRASA